MSYTRRGQCRYCSKGSSNGEGPHGKNCLYSPDGYHEEIGDALHCIRCGSVAYGKNCMMSNNKSHIHIHGHGPDQKGNILCIYCGKPLRSKTGSVLSTMTGCLYSPNGKHQA